MEWTRHALFAGLGSRDLASNLNPFNALKIDFNRGIAIFGSGLDFQLIFEIVKG